MFRATKGSGVTITTILRNNAIETRPGNKIHHLGEKRSACVHCAPDWKTRIGEDVTSRILDRVQGATKKNTSETLVLQRYAEILPSVNRTAVKALSNFMALLNFEWLSRVWVDGGEVEFAGDEEEDCFHGLQASVSARLSFGGLKQSIDGFDEAIGLA